MAALNFSNSEESSSQFTREEPSDIIKESKVEPLANHPLVSHSCMLAGLTVHSAVPVMVVWIQLVSASAQCF